MRKVKKGLDQSDTLKSLGKLTASSFSVGLGTMVGSGLYGTGSNAPTAFMAGVAMNSSVKGFFEHSTKTLSENVTDNYQALNVKSKYGVHSMTQQVMDLFSDDEVAKRELTGIMEEIEKALAEAGIEGTRKTQIKNTIERGVRADGSRTQDVIKFALENVKDKKGNIMQGADGKSLYETNDGGIRKAAEHLADYVNMNQIYKSIRSAGDLNVDNDTFVEEVMNNFDDEYDQIEEPKISRREVITPTREIENADPFDTNESEQPSDIDYEQMVDETINDLLDVISINTYSRIGEKRKRDIIRRALRDIDGQVTTIEHDMEQEYEKKLEEAIKSLEKEKNNIQNDAEDQVLKAKLIRMKKIHEQLEKIKRNDRSNVPKPKDDTSVD